MSAEFIVEPKYRSDHRSAGRFIWSNVKQHPLLAFGLVLGAFINALLAAIVPNFIGEAFNAMVNSDNTDLKTVGAMAIAVLISQGARSVVQFVRNGSAAAFAQRIERDVRDELYASLLGKSMSFHDSIPVGETMARVTNDVRELNLMMYPGVNLIIGSGMFLIAPLISTPFIHPSLLLVPILFLVCHVIVQFRFVRQAYPVAQRVRSSFGRMNASLAESLDGVEVVKGAAQEDQEIHNFSALADEVRDNFVAQGRIEAKYLSYLLLGLSFVFGFMHSVYLYQLGWIQIGDIVAFTSLLGLFGFPVFTSLNALSRIALGYASAGRILDVITAETSLDRDREHHKEPMQGAITFENVTFGYVGVDGSEEEPILHDISFTVYTGHTVAIVGQTGSGKSTLTKLINRIYDPTAGRVLIDGIDLKEWDLQSLRSQISIIEQDIFLFSRTIAENIAFGHPDATKEQIIEAAKKAQAHDFILSFPDGYETEIGQRGVTLSGGQRQRLAIARAFLTNPPVLILDDSTSAIDSATEDKIQKAIWSAAEGRTTLLITHRLSQIRWADHIVVLRRGRIVAQGTHDHLLKNSESYQRIFARYESSETQKQRSV
ncbi:MAG: ABC transporter ATP-binding protein [Aggregatilineales bacterium]